MPIVRKMLSELKLYATCFISIIVIDLIWLGIVAKGFYLEQLRPIGRIAGDKFEPVLWSAGACYIALSIGVVQFALPKIAAGSSWPATFGIGALLGFVIYATYDFTNHSTLKDWTTVLTFADIAWGSFLIGTVTCVARYVRDL